MIATLALGLVMASVCLALQAAAGVLALRLFRGRRGGGLWARYRRLSLVLAVLTLGVFAQMAVWAGLWRLLGSFGDFETALYFSGVTFTSLGYGDVVLRGHERLLAPLEAATGLIMFAVLTAVFIAALQHEAKGRDD